MPENNLRDLLPVKNFWHVDLSLAGIQTHSIELINAGRLDCGQPLQTDSVLLWYLGEKQSDQFSRWTLPAVCRWLRYLVKDALDELIRFHDLDSEEEDITSVSGLISTAEIPVTLPTNRLRSFASHVDCESPVSLHTRNSWQECTRPSMGL